MNFSNVKVNMMYTPDQQLMLFLCENDTVLGHLIYQKQVHNEKNNMSAHLLQKLFNKRHLNAKDIVDIIGGNTSLKKKIEKIFDFLPKESVKSFFPIFSENRLEFTPVVKLSDFIAEDTPVYFKSGHFRKVNFKELDDYIANYYFKVSNDGSYELEMGIDHNYTTEHIYAIEKTQLHFEYNFYNKDSYHDWQLFSSLDAFKIGIMWFKLPEPDVPELVDNSSTSALSGCGDYINH